MRPEPVNDNIHFLILFVLYRQSLPAVSQVTAANFDEFKNADRIVAIAYVSSTSDAPAPEFSKTAEKHRDDFLFGLSSDEDAIAAAGVTPPAIVLYRQFDEPESTYPYPITSASVKDIEEWIQELSVPVIGEVNAENYAVYAASSKPLAYLFVDPSDEAHKEHIESIRPIAAEHKSKVNFVWIDAIKFGDHAKALNLQEPVWPSFVIQDLTKQLKFPFDQNIRITPERIAEMLENFHAGKLEPELKSQPIPATQDESVYNLVGKEFDKVVMDKSKDVFVEFYASWYAALVLYIITILTAILQVRPLQAFEAYLGLPWRSFPGRQRSCRHVSHIFLHSRLTLNLYRSAKMETQENDIPPSAPFRVSGFPTLKFKPAGSEEFLDYDGDRSLESLIAFVEENAKNSLESKAPVNESKPEEHAEVHDEL